MGAVRIYRVERGDYFQWAVRSNGCKNSWPMSAASEKIMEASATLTQPTAMPYKS